MIYVEMFFELDTCRNGMSGGPIPFTDIYNFATIKDVEDFNEFLYLIRRMDKVLMEFREKQNDHSSKNNKNKG